MATLKVTSLGDYIREQRESAQVSLRQLAKSAGVSNPYLSQIERGLKKPSAEILQQIAKGLRISAETLYVRAGILDEEHGGGDVRAAVLADAGIGERHKRVLLDIYESFRAEHAAATVATSAAEKKAVRKAAGSTPRAAATKRSTATKPARKSATTKPTAKRATAAKTTKTTQARTRRNS
ncbi:MAG TPA: helix-turn-helix transcriptional regulator [Actinomycetes bacterium]|nr:helix-turn-helix transcriptional regulator [Actinomycetes bacterium]